MNRGRRARPLKKKPILAAFAEPSDDDEDEQQQTMVGSRPIVLVGRPTKATAEPISHSNEEQYQYDEVYDDMQNAKQQSLLRRQQKRKSDKPVHMQSLIEAAERRKRDFKFKETRRIIREKQENQEEYKNTEKFVTSAYKQRLEETKKYEEEQRKQEEIDKKKSAASGSMQGFYKSMLEGGADEDKKKMQKMGKNESRISQPVHKRKRSSGQRHHKSSQVAEIKKKKVEKLVVEKRNTSETISDARKRYMERRKAVNEKRTDV